MIILKFGKKRNNPNMLELVLINRKTGKVASISSQFNILCVQAYLKNDFTGISRLFASKGATILRYNKLVLKQSRKPKSGHVNEHVRLQAKSILPVLAALWGEQLPKYRAPRRKDFANWVAKQFRDNGSCAFSYAAERGFDELLDAQRSARWWLDQLEKMQS